MPQYAVSFINSQYLGENYILSYFFLPLVDYFFFSFLTAIWSRANFQLSDRFRSDICIDFIWDCRLVRLWQLTVALFPENGGSWNFLWIEVQSHWLVLSWQMTEHVSDDTRSLKGLNYSRSENPDFSHDYYYLCILFRPLLRHIHSHWISHRCLMETLETATRLHPTVCSFF